MPGVLSAGINSSGLNVPCLRASLDPFSLVAVILDFHVVCSNGLEGSESVVNVISYSSLPRLVTSVVFSTSFTVMNPTTELYSFSISTFSFISVPGSISPFGVDSSFTLRIGTGG